MTRFPVRIRRRKSRITRRAWAKRTNRGSTGWTMLCTRAQMRSYAEQVIVPMVPGR